ncbi:MAG: alpha/beta hydrolase [Alphaproteobacteria bacterium]|nr:alpha/beta hydrolase [Alphaproteobacteria bacterium]
MGRPKPEVRDEVVHGDRLVTVEREWLCLEDGPPLAVERTVRKGGPTRPPVILVHGFAQNRFTWRISGRSMVAALADAGYEVLSLELRGHGLSRELGSGNATEFTEYIEDLERVVAICDRPPFAIGHSLGGAVVVGAASRVELAGVVPIAGVYTFATRNPTLRALGRLTLAAEPALRASPVRMSTGWAGRLLGRLYSVTDIAGYGFPISGWVPGSIERELLEERLELGFDWTSVEVWIEMSRWANGAPVPGAEAFRGVDVPLLVIVGDADPLVRPADAKNCFEASGSADKQLVVMDAFHHRVHWGHVDLILGKDAPELVWPQIIDWLDRRAK